MCFINNELLSENSTLNNTSKIYLSSGCYLKKREVIKINGG